MSNNPTVKKILILAANPKNTVRLRLDQEVRDIEQGLQLAAQRDKFSLQQKWAVRSRDIRLAVLDFRPNIIHFSGHGSETEGLSFEDEVGKEKFVTADALGGLFKLFANHVECVLLNACYSEVQANAIAQDIDYVIGMNAAIGDRAALEFSVGFYDALARYDPQYDGDSPIEFAFNVACSSISLAGVGSASIPVLIKNPNRKPKSGEADNLLLGQLIGDVPNLPPHFLPRDEQLNPLKQKVLTDTNRRVAITGTSNLVGVQDMGGIGKTVLATALARDEEVRRAFPDGVIWITLGQTPQIFTWQSYIAKALGDNQAAFTEISLAKVRLRELLTDKACLLILDDVWNLEDAKAFDVLGEGCQILITTHDVRIITGLNGEQYQLSMVEVRTISAHSNSVNALAFSPDGEYLVSGSLDSTLKVWDWQTGVEVRTISGHSDSVNAIAFSPDGKYLVSGSDDTTVKVWDWQTGVEVRTLTGHSDWVKAIAFSFDGKYLVSGFLDFTLKVWDWQTGVEVRTLTGHSDWVKAIAFSPDCKYLVSGSLDFTLKVWDWQTGVEVRTLTGHTRSVNALAFSPDGKYLISGSSDCTLKVWDWQTGVEVRTLTGHNNLVKALIFSPDGKYLISGSSDCTLKVWDWQTGIEVRTLTGHSNSVNAIIFSPNGKYLVSGSSDFTLKVWDWQTGIEVRTLTGHSEWINAVAVTLDGREIISGSHDSILKIWDLKTGEELRTLTEHNNTVFTVAVSSDGRMIASGSADGTMCLWQQVRSTEPEQSSEDVKIKTRRWYFNVEKLTTNLAVGEDLILNLNFTPDSQLGSSIRVPANTLELTVYIEASGFYLQGEHTRTLPVKDGKLMERSLTLNLTPLVSGDRTINLSIYPGGRLPNLSPEKLPIKVRINTPTVLPNIPELIDRRTIPAPEPDVILHVTLEDVLNEEQLIGLQWVGLYLTCPALSCDRQPLESLHFTANELERLRQSAIQAAAVANGSPVDVLTSLQAIGATLFDRLMPIEHPLRNYYWELFKLTDSDTPLSWLIVSEAKAVLPWELVCAYGYDPETGKNWYDEFLAQKCILAHWVGYQGLKLANEAPLLELGLTHYNQRPEHLSRWQKVLGSEAQAKSNQQSGLLDLMQPSSSCYGLHILRYTDPRQTEQITSYEANPEHASGKTLNQAEELLYNQRLDFTLRRPVVGLSLVDGQTANRGMAMSGSDNQLEADWMLPLMHAGASALVGSRWSVLPESDRLFYRTFYNLMRSGRELGSAVWQARKDVKLAFPHRSDWLAYTYFGHPQCQPYLVRPSQGFTFFEAINPPENEKFLAGESYDFRASYRIEAPVWYSGRLSLQEISKKAEDLSVMMVHLTGEMPPNFYQLEPVASNESYQHIITITMPSKEMILPLLIRFQKGSEELNTLFLNLNIVDRGQP